MLRIAVLFLCLCVCTVEMSSSQPIRWGISASASIHELDFEAPLDFWDASNRSFPSVMFHMELPMRFVEGPLGELLWLSSGVRYTRLASKVDFENEVGSGNQLFTGAFSINQHYLAIPVQFRLDLGKLPVFITAGPEFGVLVYANKVSETFTPVEFQSSDTRKITSDLKRVNTSLYGGVGVEFKRGVALFGRFGRGLNHVLKGGEQTVSVSDWLTNEFEIGLKVDFER